MGNGSYFISGKTEGIIRSGRQVRPERVFLHLEDRHLIWISIPGPNADSAYYLRNKSRKNFTISIGRVILPR